MEDLVADRIKRLHGDFLDHDGEYELVSSLSSATTTSGSTSNSQEQHQEGIDGDYEVLRVQQADFIGYLEGIGNYHQASSSFALLYQSHGSLFFFLFKLLWAMATFCVIVGLYFRWMDVPPSKLMQVVRRKTRQYYASVLTCTAQTPPSSGKSRVVYPPTTTNKNTQETVKLKRKPGVVLDGGEKQNLSMKFERVREEDLGPKSQQHVLGIGETTAAKDTETTVIRESIQHVKTTTTLVTNSEMAGNFRSVQNQVSLQSSERSSNTTRKLLVQETRSPPRSLSPPKLRSEPPLEEYPLSPSVCSHSNSGPDDPSTPDSPQSASSLPHSRTPITVAKTTSPYPPTSSPSTPLRFDASLTSAIQNASTVESSPHRFAQEFCQNVEIIEKVLMKSGAKVDSSRAVELAMMHQSSQMKLQEEEQRYSFQAKRQSSLQLDKYEEYLKELSMAREKCLESIGRSFNHSTLVCVVLEGCRYAVHLMDALEYFSFKQAGRLLLHMACGCDDNDEATWESGVPDLGSYFSFRSALDSVLRSVEPSLTRSTEYFFCALSFGLSFLAWRIVHTVIRGLHCPSFLHQAVNGMILAMYLAQNPGAWVVVTRNFELYKFWAMIQCVLTAGSFAVAVSWHIKTRNCILERHRHQAQKLQQLHSFDDQVSVCEARKRILHYDDLSWIFTVVPPMVMGLVVLMTTN